MRDHSHAARPLEPTVCRVAASNLDACVLLHAVGVHFGDEALRTIADVTRDDAMDARQILELQALTDLDTTSHGAAEVWWALDEVCARLVQNHHARLRTSIDALETALERLAESTDADRPQLRDAQRRLEQLAVDLRGHFAKEENILFPALTALVDARRRHERPPALPFPSVLHPIRMMEGEHERVERELAGLRALVEGLHPIGLDAAWRTFQSQVSRFAAEFSAHAQFENDLLFPRALELERALL
jgi:regulator of cell morphogenesis and NO signaling